MSSNEIEEIKQRIDLVELVGSYVQIKKAGTNYKAVCPFHQEKTPSLMVSPEKQIWKCFGCGKSGDVFTFVMEMESLEFGDALKLLAQKAGVVLQPKTAAEHQTRDRKETIYRLNQFASFFFHKIFLEHASAKVAREYLKKRQVSAEIIEQWRIGFAARGINFTTYALKRGFTTGDLKNAGNPEKFFERIVFPIYDVLGNVIAFTGRALGDHQPKYLNSPETVLYNKGRVWYGLNFAKGVIKEKDFVVLVEGQMDVLSLHQNGVKNVVASSGTAITEAQLMILSKYTTNFLLAFDNDDAGRATTKKVIEMVLKLDLDCKVADFGQYKDAGELFEADPKSWAKVAKTAQEGVDWLIAQALITVEDAHFIENKKKVIKQLLPILTMVEGTRLDHYVQRLAISLELKTETIYSAVNKQPTVKSSIQKPTQSATNLSNEEQLLAVILARPQIFGKISKRLTKMNWLSVETARVAKVMISVYNDDELTKNYSQTFSQVKTQLGSPLGEKLDSWIFSVTNQWKELTDQLAESIIDEKFAQLEVNQYENKKEQLAFAIRRAQEAGDIEEVKKLMMQLNEITKEKGKNVTK